MFYKKKQLKKILFKSIRTTMFFSFLLLILVSVVAFFGISLKVTKEAIVDNSIAYTKQLILQVNSTIDNYINYMENISTIVSCNTDVRTYLLEETEEAEQASYYKIINQFETLLNMREDIYNIAILGKNGKFVLNRGNDQLNPYMNIEETNWYIKAIEANGNRILSSSHVQNLVYDRYKWVITMSKAIKSNNNDKIIGTMLVDLNYSAITNLCQRIDLGNRGYIFILDEHGKFVYHPKQQLLYTGIKTEYRNEVLSALKKGEDYFFVEGQGKDTSLYTISQSEKTGWTIVGVVYLSELQKNESKTKLTYTIAALLLLGIALFMAYLLAWAITKPIKILRNSMKEAEKGNFKQVKIQIVDDNEIGMLSRSFNIMIEEIQNLMADKIRNQQEKYKLELKSLQAQINPHFLYNTLDSIVWMAEGGKNQEVVIMTSSLAKLLRQSISNAEELISIEQEVNYVKSYLTIQKMRYKDQLTYEIDVEKEIYHIPTIRLILQPLVENAIYHGIKYQDRIGKISIRGYETEEEVILEVSDNGIGMTDETLAHIFDQKEKERKNSNGIGVGNVNRRIKLYYGENYGLKYESEYNVGTIVRVIFPREREE